jgi:hypothetical protein
MPKKLSKKQQVAEAARLTFYKHWHDQFRRNPKYAEWSAEKKAKGRARKMKAYDKKAALALA